VAVGGSVDSNVGVLVASTEGVTVGLTSGEEVAVGGSVGFNVGVLVASTSPSKSSVEAGVEVSVDSAPSSETSVESSKGIADEVTRTGVPVNKNKSIIAIAPKENFNLLLFILSSS